MKRGTPRRSRAAARGLTLLEVVLASALLAMVASTVFGAFHFMMSRQQVERQHLLASELANRLMLQYLDEKSTLPDPSLPLASSGDRFRWELRADPVILRPVEPEKPAENAQPARGMPLLQRVKQVTVRVWLSEESGGEYSFVEGLPSAKLTRLVYPMAGRNPDSFNKLLDNLRNSDSKMRSLLEEEGPEYFGPGGSSGGGSSARPATGRSGTPSRSGGAGKAGGNRP